MSAFFFSWEKGLMICHQGAKAASKRERNAKDAKGTAKSQLKAVCYLYWTAQMWLIVELTDYRTKLPRISSAAFAGRLSSRLLVVRP